MSTRTTTPTDSSIWFKLLNLLLGLGALTLFGIVGLIAIFAISAAWPATSAKAYWFVSRSSGVLAYLLLTLGVLWGLVQSGSILRPTIPPLLALGLHSFLNWGALVMSVLHALILLGDKYIKLSLLDLTVPFVSPYKPLALGLGILGLYLMFLLSSSFYARKWLGQKTFHKLHYISYPTFVLVTAHGLAAGTDGGLMWLLSIFSLGAIGIFAMWRIVSAGRQSATVRHP